MFKTARRPSARCSHNLLIDDDGVMGLIPSRPLSGFAQRERPVGGWALSLALHALAVLLAYLLSPLLKPPPLLMVDPIEVQLLVFADQTSAPIKSDAVHPSPAQSAPSRHSHTDKRPPPKPSMPTPQETEDTSVSDFDRQLRGAAVKAQGNKGAGSAPTLGQSGYSLKDYVRAQIQQHWNFDVTSLGRSHWIIAIHVIFDPEGTVTRAEIVTQDPLLNDNAHYLSLAHSALSAVLIASPVVLPKDLPQEQREMVLDFDPQTLLR